MATIKRLCIANLQEPLGVSFLPFPGGCPAPARALAGGGQAAHGPSRAPCSPAASLSLSSLSSPLHPVWWGSGSLSPLHQPQVPSQDTSLGWSLQCKSWLQRTYGALSYTHNRKTDNDFRNAKVSGCARLVGRWEMEMLSLSWGRGQDIN